MDASTAHAIDDCMSNMCSLAELRQRLRALNAAASGPAVARSQAMRLFTALELPDDVRARLAAFIAALRRGCPESLRFVDARQLHVTTKFVGERDDVDAVVAALWRVPRRGAVEVVIGGTGFFPDAHRPRVLWAGVQRTPSLVALAEDTERQLAVDCGIAPDVRAFSPHLTLARVRSAAEARALQAALTAAEDDARFGRFQATTFALVASEAEGGAHRHTTVATFGVGVDEPPSAPPSASTGNAGA